MGGGAGRAAACLVGGRFVEALGPGLQEDGGGVGDDGLEQAPLLLLLLLLAPLPLLLDVVQVARLRRQGAAAGLRRRWMGRRGQQRWRRVGRWWRVWLRRQLACRAKTSWPSPPPSLIICSESALSLGWKGQLCSSAARTAACGSKAWVALLVCQPPAAARWWDGGGGGLC